MKNKLICLILIFILSQISFAMDAKETFIASAETGKVLKIGMVDCIAYALKNNSEIKIKSIEPKLKKDDVIIANADFEPTLNFDYTVHNNAKETSSALSGANISKTRDLDINAGISGKLYTGTEYDVDFTNEELRSNSNYQSVNPSHTVEPKITITQPLFKGFGILVNKADIIIARNNRDASRENFKDTVMDIITKTKTAYYDCIYFRENYSIARLSLERAKDLLEINKARYEKGLVSSVDLLETETVVAQREKALISLEASLKKAEDNLKLITSLVADPGLWNAELELIDSLEFTPTPDGVWGFNEQEPDLTKSLKNAFEFRPDYIAQRIDLKNRDIKIKVAKNDLFPTVDLTGSFGLNGLGREYEKALREIDDKYKDWEIGVEVSIPWGGGERAKYDKKKLEKAQALIAFKKLEQTIILEVRDKVRDVDIESRQVKASNLSKEKETENYNVQKERYRAGEVSTHDMLDYQDRLAQAELDYIKALIDYNIAIINLEKAQGITLAKNNIILEE